MRYRQNTKGDILYGPPVKSELFFIVSRWSKVALCVHSWRFMITIGMTRRAEVNEQRMANIRVTKLLLN